MQPWETPVFPPIEQTEDDDRTAYRALPVGHARVFLARRLDPAGTFPQKPADGTAGQTG